MDFGAPFEQLEAEAHLDIQEAFQTTWLFKPMVVKPNRSPEPDPERTAMYVRGMFDWQSRDVKLNLEEQKVSSRDPVLTLMRGCAPPVIKRGDQWTNMCNGGTFETVQTQPDGYSGIVVNLVQVGRSF